MPDKGIYRILSVDKTLKADSPLRHLHVVTVMLLVVFFILSGVSASSQIEFAMNSGYRYLKGSGASAISGQWMTDSYSDASWSVGNAPFRYGDGTGGTLLSDMINNYSTLYLRTSFNAFSTDRIKELALTIDYDDGFVIWINGEQVLSQNAPAVLSSAALATANHESGTPVVFTIDSSDVSLVEGENLLCIQGFNVTLGSSDFYFDMSIDASLSLPEVSDTLLITFDHEAGFYDTPFDLLLETEETGYDIIYTLDGSNPQTSATGVRVSSPVTVTVDPGSSSGRAATPVFIVRASLVQDGLSPSKPVTRSFIFLDNVLTQSYPGGDWPSSTVNSQVIDLDMDPDIVNDVRYSADMKASLLDIPSVSLVTDNADMFSSSKGIYVNAYYHGDQWERQCSVELINPDGTQGFQVNAGVRIRGGASRTGDNPKHAFRLFFRKEYGPGKLLFPLFGDEGADEFDKVDLRTAQNYSWSKDGDTHNTFLRDIFSRDLQRDMGQPYTRGRYYHLYLNGMYWGLYQTEERPEASYAETYLGGDEEDYDVVKVAVETWPYMNEATDGTLASWQDLWNKCTSGFVSDASYFALEGKDQNGLPVKNTRIYVDIDNLIDYMLVIFYTGNVDAPVSAWYSNRMPNNYFALFNRENKGQGFVFIGHDSEHSMFVDPIYVSQGISENRVTINDPSMYASGVTDFQPQWLHQKLTLNDEYCLRFADRAYRYFASGGALSPERCLERWRARKEEIDMAIIAESARWGDARTTSPRNKTDDWLPEVNDIEIRYFPYRSQIVINQLTDAGLYLALAPPLIKRDGEEITEDLSFDVPFTVSLENPNTGGKIYYTTDGSDPRERGGKVSSSAVATGSTSMTISSTTLLKTRISDGQSWSAMNRITFSSVYEDYSDLKVTEVHYHPADVIAGTDTTDGKDLEFIELKNTGENSLNISGVTIDTAVYYTVPDAVVIPPKGFFVVASKPAAFYEYYGMNPSGNFKGNLSNAGEYVLVYDNNNNEILSFTYSDAYPWPVNADGGGYSLVSANVLPVGDPDDYTYWRSSFNIGGSPFADDVISTAVTSLADGQGSSKMILYPNPAYDEVNIFIDDEVSGVITIRFADLRGNIVLTRTIDNNAKLYLSETGIAPGVYIVTAEYDGTMHKAILVYSSGR